ncbi:MAG: hypothetical protein QM534_16225 [Sediminibacterium sp.]|nr:hypothetical protein [Sediminibacterium sp.]
MKSTFRYISVCIATGLLLSFKPVSPEFTEIRDVFNRLNTAPTPEKESTLIRYQVTSVSKSPEKNGTAITNKSTFELFASRKQNRVYSQDMIVLKDQETTFAILPSRKMIYISDAVTGKKDENIYSRLRTLQDTIFGNAEQVTTQKVKEQPHDKIIHITLNKRMSGFLGIKKIQYYINSSDKTLKRVFIEYGNGNPLISLDYVFTQTVFHCKEQDMSIPVKKLVFQSAKTALPVYADYKVIDNRKK